MKLKLRFLSTRRVAVPGYLKGMEQQVKKWLEVLKDFDCGILYHPGKLVWLQMRLAERLHCQHFWSCELQDKI